MRDANPSTKEPGKRAAKAVLGKARASRRATDILGFEEACSLTLWGLFLFIRLLLLLMVC
jgi:hypothetical protein